jgi:hypothetical protein
MQRDRGWYGCACPSILSSYPAAEFEAKSLLDDIMACRKPCSTWAEYELVV